MLTGIIGVQGNVALIHQIKDAGSLTAAVQQKTFFQLAAVQVKNHVDIRSASVQGQLGIFFRIDA